MALSFEERTQGCEPSGRFGLDSAEYQRVYVLSDRTLGVDNPITTKDVTDHLLLITGGTNPGPAKPPLGAPGGAGSIDRMMPLVDPQFLSLAADVPALRIVPMEGYAAATADGTGLALPPLVPGHALYQAAEYVVPFSARPYAMVPNSRMVMLLVDYYDVDGSRWRLNYYREDFRWCSVFFDDLDSNISASVAGGMVYRAPGAGGKKPDGALVPEIPAFMVPDQKMIIKWWGVPQRYVSSPSSFLTRYKGFINQLPYDDANGKVYEPGSILFLGAKTSRTYTPPQYSVPAVSSPILQGSFAPSPLVDLELSFVVSRRRRNVTGSVNDPDAVPSVERPNNSWVDGPLNWGFEWHSRRWLYVHANAPQKNGAPDYASWHPLYDSAPIPFVLFQDPDVPGVVLKL